MSTCRNKYMFDVEGQISQILLNESAEIQFSLNGKTEKALLKRARFYHFGKPIPEEVPLAEYIRNEMQDWYSHPRMHFLTNEMRHRTLKYVHLFDVKAATGKQVIFSCHILEPQEGCPPNPYHTVQYHWFVTMCRANNRESPLTAVTISGGISSTLGVISRITKRHGVLSMIGRDGHEHKVAFLASKVYLHGKRFSSSKMLNTQLCLDEKMFFDGVPCIPEEDGDHCRWFATCAFQGKRPRLANPSDFSTNDFQANYLVHKPQIGGKDGSTNDKNHQIQQSPANLKNQLLKVIKLYTNNPRTLFNTGYGFIFDIINDEFGIILGCFKKNVYQTILFHRKNAFLFKVPLARAKLTEIFMEGDRMKFIAVGAPSNFYTDWIAVQVSVSTSVYRADDNIAM